jgi:hypothetical protein
MNSTEVSSLAAHNRCLSRPNLTVAEDRGVSEYFVLCSERLLDAICTQLCEFVVAGCPMSIEVCSRLAHGEGIIGRHPHKLSTFLHLAAPTRSPHGRAALRVRFGTSLEGVTRPFFFFFFFGVRRDIEREKSATDCLLWPSPFRVKSTSKVWKVLCILTHSTKIFESSVIVAGALRNVNH